MIISKTPFRVSLFGGSTDYESFYSKHESVLIGFALDKYCYLSVRENPHIFPYKSKVAYSLVEEVQENSDIRHNGVRGVLDYLDLSDVGLEINYWSDLPSQTGIGSSSSFVVGLINCLGKYRSPASLAIDSIAVEREHLKEAGGIQDQIWAAYGGLKSITINNDGDFFVRPLPVCDDFVEEFLARSVLIYTGKARKSFEIARSHDTGSDDLNKLEILETARNAYYCFQKENINDIAFFLKKSWNAKRQISDLICSPEVNEMFEKLESYGLMGGKLLGSGGSGFIFGILDHPKRKQEIREVFDKHHVEFNISDKGSEVIHQ